LLGCFQGVGWLYGIVVPEDVLRSSCDMQLTQLCFVASAAINKPGYVQHILSHQSLFVFNAPLANHSLIQYRDHAVTTPGQLAISPQTSLCCPLCTLLNHRQLFGFFFLFLFNDFWNSGNIRPYTRLAH